MTKPPVVLLHGLASSFTHNWRDPGWVDLLVELGRQVVPVDLPGHGQGPHPTDPAAYADVVDQVVRQIDAAVDSSTPLDAVGFSAGAETLLRLAAVRPQRFRRLAVLGVSSSILEASDGAIAALADALERPEDPVDVQARLFRRMAEAAGNDAGALVAFLRRPRRPLTEADLSRVRCPVLVVLGDRDLVGPPDRLLAALPDAHLVTLRGVDHFGTPSDHRCLDAVLRFLDA
ncbi:MAG: alpha/beta hydrolase fold protein [Dactylosporangium sp.]|jgi:pimeloyl-ACP methyl ester carboxylesterase|nr:alpha/beta hydrolase fold protein [Dactylosporangium sp.]